MSAATRLREFADEAVLAREEPGLGLAADAERVARACRDMAVRFDRGGKLVVFGNGGAGADADHIAVEFVHPVIVGKRALPALSLNNDTATITEIGRSDGFEHVFAHQLGRLADPGDIALGVSPDGDCANVARALETAAATGLLTVALVGGDGGAVARGGAADHLLHVHSDDPMIVKEVHVTTYHILWELVHVFFENPALLEREASA
ncbi:D-sedoheptulose-7-phosphate isomerase [Streptomonospora litoralis]|uniref:Phosphoheptose isomerase n=1 Tax=Streptomonospora litoralis TaxID=2498135 RepID=A0A4P6Q3Z6_9ACTN|nr:SIS domain-containing protein [Streptomonospora litoralis]QBI53544.1 Phosphoheptose isomerase [Streptomonospora litoralis]